MQGCTAKERNIRNDTDYKFPCSTLHRIRQVGRRLTRADPHERLQWQNKRNKSLYYYSGSAKGSKAAKAIFDVLAPFTPGKSESVSANNGLLEVNTPDAPTAYVEVDFHDVPSIAKWITANTTAIGEKIAQGICKYFGMTYKAQSVSKPTTATVKIEAPNLSEYLKEGDRNLAVYAYKQQLALLKKKGIISQGVDNNEIFGAGTKTATMQVQRAAGITVDGLAGPQTIRACYVLAAK